MNVHSSTSNSDIFISERLIPPGKWLLAVISGAVVFLFFGAYLEWQLALRRVQPGIVDTDAAWKRQRARATSLGDKAIILIGASRIQLDVDLDVVREQTGLTPVQLALDGSSFVPVLAGLANDTDITGTIVVDYQDVYVNSFSTSDQSFLFEKEWEQQDHRAWLPTFSSVESQLSAYLRSHLRSYADGARPMSSLVMRALGANSTPQYMTTSATRSRRADYRAVRMPDFYLAQVKRGVEFETGHSIPIGNNRTNEDVQEYLQSEISKLNPASYNGFEINTQRIASMVSAIEKRGGRVVFVVMPTSGMVEEIVDKVYPREKFLDYFKARVRAPMVDVVDFPQFSRFWCPDGSHLDYRDQKQFTEALVTLLQSQHAL